MRRVIVLFTLSFLISTSFVFAAKISLEDWQQQLDAVNREIIELQPSLDVEDLSEESSFNSLEVGLEKKLNIVKQLQLLIAKKGALLEVGRREKFMLVADVDAGKIFLNKASSELSHISNALSSAIDSAEVAAAFVDNAPADLLSFADDLDAQYEALVVLNDELQSFLRKPGTLDEMGVIVPADAIIPNFTSIPVVNPTVRSFLEKKGLDPSRFDFRALLNELIAPVDLNDNNAARAAFARLSKSKQKEIKNLKVQLTQPLHEELHSLRTESAYIRSLAEKSPTLNKSVLSQFVDFFKVRLYPEIAKKADLINEAVDAASPIRLVGGVPRFLHLRRSPAFLWLTAI